MSTAKVIFYFSAGLVTGASLGVLFAPEKGKGMEAGSRILKMKDDYIDEWKQKFDDFIDGVSGKLEKVRETVNELANQAQSKLEGVKLETRKEHE
ncbi:MAG: YtxH domain-containing protein [Bacteroidota bacterium]|nr:YtxH domain-containing protein [Bacteroidota bacterium]